MTSQLIEVELVLDAGPPGILPDPVTEWFPAIPRVGEDVHLSDEGIQEVYRVIWRVREEGGQRTWRPAVFLREPR